MGAGEEMGSWGSAARWAWEGAGRMAWRSSRVVTGPVSAPHTQRPECVWGRQGAPAGQGAAESPWPWEQPRSQGEAAQTDA